MITVETEPADDGRELSPSQPTLAEWADQSAARWLTTLEALARALPQV